MIAKCSHGSIWAEKKAMKKDEEELKRKEQEKTLSDEKMHTPTVVFPDVLSPTTTKDIQTT